VTRPRETDDLAQRYRIWRERSLGAITERLELTTVLELMEPLAGKRVLDAGCGDGMYSLAASERGALVTGVDLSADMLAVARGRSAARGVTVDWKQADVMALPFRMQALIWSSRSRCSASCPMQGARCGNCRACLSPEEGS
jgi:2-polyprenyl-3-methyl-5-hydroxy-6-metoxy-1,4-benzoquinol methylase